MPKGYNYFLDIAVTQLGNRAGLISSDLSSEYYKIQFKQADSLLDLLSHIKDVDFSSEKLKLIQIKADLTAAINQMLEIENRA